MRNTPFQGLTGDPAVASAGIPTESGGGDLLLVVDLLAGAAFVCFAVSVFVRKVFSKSEQPLATAHDIARPPRGLGECFSQ